MRCHQTVKLGDVCEVIMGQSPSSETYNSEQIGLPFFQGNADFGEESPIPTIWCSSPKKTAKRGDILISVRAPIGSINTASEECCIGRGVAAIRSDEDRINSAFLRCYLFSNKHKLEDMGTGSTFPAIGKKTLSQLEIKLYSLDDQLKISQNIDAISRNIRSSRKQLEMLDRLVKSRFIEMFGNPADARYSPIGCQPIGEFCEVKIGPFGSILHKEDYISGGHPLVNPSHIINGRIEIDSRLTVTEEKYKSMEAFHLQKNDVVLGRRGEIGRCAVVNQDGLLCGTGSMILRPDINLCYSGYLQYVISFPSFAKVLEKSAVGITMKNLNAKSVSNALIILPRREVQEEFLSFAVEVDKLRFDVQRQIDKLETFKAALMQKYFD